MALAAGQVGRDSSLKLGGIANSGTVEAIAPVAGERNVYAVVTREQTTATNTNAYQGLRPAWHVTLATVTRGRRPACGRSAAGSPRTDGSPPAPCQAQCAATFSATAAPKQATAATRSAQPARSPGRPVTIPTIANDMQPTEMRASNRAKIRSTGRSAHGARMPSSRR